MKKTIIKTFGNAYQTVTLSEEITNKYTWADSRELDYTEHVFRITVHKNNVGITNDYVVAKYNDVHGDGARNAREDALRIAEIDMNCIMTYGI